MKWSSKKFTFFGLIALGGGLAIIMIHFVFNHFSLPSCEDSLPLANDTLIQLLESRHVSVKSVEIKDLKKGETNKDGNPTCTAKVFINSIEHRLYYDIKWENESGGDFAVGVEVSEIPAL